MSRNSPVCYGSLLGVLIVLLALLVTAPVAQASKAVTGAFGASGGEGNGQLDEPKGVAVNLTGAGGVNAGDVYVVDSLNNRVEEFSAAGAFVRAFGYDVVASGPDNTGANEQQTLTVDATGGMFAVAVSRNTLIEVTEGSNVISHLYAPTSAYHVGDTVVKGPFPAGTTITAVGTDSLVLSAPATSSSEPFSNLEFGAAETTSSLPFNSTPGELEAALAALPAIGSGDVSVTGSGATTGLAIEYKGALGHNDAFHTSSGAKAQDAVTTVVSTGLTGGVTHTASIFNTVHGGGYEICDASGPNDVCKAGPHCGRGETSVEACQESYAAGSLNEPNGVAVDQKNGDVYVTDVTANETISNNRVDVYSATGAFEGAFGWDVNATSPKEELQFCTTVTGCQHGSRGSGPGQFNALFRSLPALGPAGHVFVPEGESGGKGNHRVNEFVPVLNGAEEVTGVSFAAALGWDVIASGPDQATEIQKVTVRAGVGKFKLGFKNVTTGELVFNAPAAEAEEVAGGPESVEKALNALSSVSAGGGSVKVTGGPGSVSGSSPYTVTFDGGPLAHTDVAQMVVTKIGMSGGSPSTVVSVETYSNGTEGLEYCVVARGDACQPGGNGPESQQGEANLRLGEFSRGNPSSVAVDQGGALYAVNSSESFGLFGPARVYKFTFPHPGEVDAQEFALEYLTQVSGEPNAVDATDVAVDPFTQNVLVAKREGVGSAEFYEFDSAGTLLERSPAGNGGVKSTGENGLAVGLGGRFYFSDSRLGLINVLGPPPPPSVTVGAATNVDAGSATLHGTVTPPPPVEGTGFDTTYHFEYSLEGSGEWSRVPADDVDVGDGSGSGPPAGCPVNNPPTCTVEQAVTGLVPNSHYVVRLVASTGSVAVSGTEAFTTEPGEPLVLGTSLEDLAETSVKLTGGVNPANEPTTYYFEWGADTTYGERIPMEVDGSAGSGDVAVQVSDVLEGLKSGSVYHFRLVAKNDSGTTVGPDREFSTLDRYGLPDGRVPEQVSPVDKRPVGKVSSGEGTVPFQASSDGGNIMYLMANGAADATAGGQVAYLGRRGGLGWLSSQLSPPSLVPIVHSGPAQDTTGRVLYAPADVSCEIVQTREPLTADTPPQDVTEGDVNLYRRSPDGTYTLLTAPVPLSGGANDFTVDWSSSDCSHVLFETAKRLLEEAPVGNSGLYEWVEGSLRIVGVQPDESAPGGESVASDAQAGLGNQNNESELTTWNSMSSDGSKVFFNAISAAGGDKGHLALFVRTKGASTIDVSQSQTATVDGGAFYATATPDGSHVFFLANYGLASNGTSAGVNGCESDLSSVSGVGCDLYDYDTATKALTDISVDSNSADSQGAGVVGLIDVSDDGSYVYFAARGQLVAGEGKTEAENVQDGTYGVYLNHEGDVSFVGRIANADTQAASSGSDMSFYFSHWAAHTTPDGKHLLFVSKANVTGYDSKGVTEAYLYSAESGGTVCVSCRTDGLASVGNGQTEPVTVNPPAAADAGANTILSRPRALSDDGRRVFFTMPDVLAAGAESRTHNIYEWEAGQVYLLVAGEGRSREPIEFGDMSPDGRDVFVVTTRKLLPQDFDNTTDLYDLRVGGGFPEQEPAPAPCDVLADRCQGEAVPRLFKPPGPASEMFSGPGNPPVTSGACKKGLVLVKGKCANRKPVVKHRKPAVKRCKKAQVRKHGKCVRKASVSAPARNTVKSGRAGR